MSALATLPMYDWPEARAPLAAFYAKLRALVPELPRHLTRPETEAGLHALWRDPALLLGQACWGPMQAGLAARVHVLAQPLYDDVPGGCGIHYRSALVMRDGTPCPVPDHEGAALPDALAGLRVAINAPVSMSGSLALAQDKGAGIVAPLITGSHRASIRAVAEGRADLAAIDCRSWALALAHEPAARALRVVGWTARRIGLPYITARSTPVALRRKLAAALARLGAQPHPELQEIP
ncbi:MAG: PhnD/SsuA/transferrin family substrate-binding protein [Rhodobacteraceae bacterium]|nr:PhnD/SsuA/transferrin family substrate-binding protein [Paracoccaceae bacterium]